MTDCLCPGVPDKAEATWMRDKPCPSMLRASTPRRDKAGTQDAAAGGAAARVMNFSRISLSSGAGRTWFLPLICASTASARFFRSSWRKRALGNEMQHQLFHIWCGAWKEAPQRTLDHGGETQKVDR